MGADFQSILSPRSFFPPPPTQELVSLHEDKISYEASAKESLALIVKEKLDSERRLAEAERALSNTEDECAHLQVGWSVCYVDVFCGRFLSSNRLFVRRTIILQGWVSSVICPQI